MYIFKLILNCFNDIIFFYINQKNVHQSPSSPIHDETEERRPILNDSGEEIPIKEEASIEPKVCSFLLNNSIHLLHNFSENDPKKT